MIEVIDNRKTEEGKNFYHRHYEAATTVDILGIMNRSFIEDLYPAYWDSANRNWDRAEEAARQRIDSSKLLKWLRNRPIRFNVRLMDPSCTYVQSRMDEAPEIEGDCRKNIVEVINALRCLYDDLMVVPTPIMGSVSVSLIDKNPYFSIFRAVPGSLMIGFITQDGLGNICPSLSISDKEDGSLLVMSADHLTRLDHRRKEIFSWNHDKKLNGDKVKFSEYRGDEHFDVFFSYNSKDELAVQNIELNLRWKGICSWYDKKSLEPGTKFWDKIVHASTTAKCATVFFGPNGPGPYQKEREIPVLLGLLVSKGLKVIPVLLEDAEPIPNWPDSLMKELHWIDFRKPKSNPLETLVKAIQAANGDD